VNLSAENSSSKNRVQQKAQPFGWAYLTSFTSSLFSLSQPRSMSRGYYGVTDCVAWLPWGTAMTAMG
jgi:hypothetical protein